MNMRKINFRIRIAAMLIICLCLYFNQRIDAVLIGLLALLATTRYD